MLLLPASAAAQRTVAVIDATAGDDPEVAAVVGALTEQLDREAKDVMVPVAAERRAALVGPVQEENRIAVADVEDALPRARDALGQFDEPKAISIADTGLTRAAGLPPSPSLMATVADLAFTRGLAQIGRDVASAERDFALVRRLDPARTLDPVRYLPEVLEAFARAGNASVETTLDVTATAGATVWVDGAEAGPAPATVTLAVGLHIVTVTGDRLLANGQLVEVPAGGATLELAAAEAPFSTIVHRLRRKLLAATDDLTRDEAVTALVRQAGAQDAFLVGRADGEVVVWTYSGRAGVVGDEAHPTEGVPIEDLVKLLRPVKITPPPRDCAEDERLIDGECVKFTPFVPPPPTPWWRKRWVQATIGGTLLAGVVTTIVAVVARDPALQPASWMGFPRE